MNKPVAYWDGKHYASKDKSSLADIPLYTQEQLEEARKLGMQQERALWNLSESTQEFESFDRTASHMAGEYVSHPAELTDEEIADFLYAYCLDMGDVYEASEAKLIECVRAILRKAQEK